MRYLIRIGCALALLCTISFAAPTVKGKTDEWSSPAPDTWFDLVVTVTPEKPLQAKGLRVAATAEGLETKAPLFPAPGSDGTYASAFEVRIPARIKGKVKAKLAVSGTDTSGAKVEVAGASTVYPGERRDDAAATVTVKGEPKAGERSAIVITLKIQDGLWVYGSGGDGSTGIPVVVRLLSAWGAGPEVLWKAPAKTSPPGEKHTKELTFEVPFTPRKAGKLDMRVAIAWQACNAELCYNTELRYVPVSMDVKPGKNGATSGDDDEQVMAPIPDGARDAATDGSRDGLGGKSLVELMLLAIGGGLFALAMPCTYPLIPITISFFTKQAESREGKVTGLALAYGLGIVAVFILVGVVVGEPIIQFATLWWVNAIFALMFLVFGLSLIGLFEIRLPSFMNDVAAKASGTGGYLSVFAMGTTLVITSFTCTAPIIGAVIVFAGKGGSLATVAFTMGVFGLTMAIPFVLLSLSPSALQAMPRSGVWMKKLKVTLGIIELGLVLKFLSNVDLARGWYKIDRELFLGLWALSFLIAGLYLLDLPDLVSKSKKWMAGKGQIFAAAFLLLVTWFLSLGLGGTPLGHVFDNRATTVVGNGIEAFLPILPDQDLPYREALLASVKEDYEAGLKVAQEKGAPILLHFTGFQ